MTTHADGTQSAICRRRRRRPFIVAVKVDVRKDLKEARKLRLSWKAIVCLIAFGLFGGLIFDHFGKLSLVLPIAGCSAALAIPVIVKPTLRSQRWFWSLMTVFIIFHALALIAITWPERRTPPPAAAGLASIDTVLMLAVIALVRELVERRADAKHPSFRSSK